MSFLDIFAKGGPVMWPILLVSVYGLTVAIERVWHFRRAQADVTKLQEDLRGLLADGFLHQALDRCDKTPGPAASVCHAVLKNSERGADLLHDAFAKTLRDETRRLQRRLGSLAVVAQVATLLGLLGTITGMIATFHAIASEPSGIVNVHVLSSGIWEAMITTAAGLSVAVPVILAYEFLKAALRSLVVEAEGAGEALMHELGVKPAGSKG